MTPASHQLKRAFDPPVDTDRPRLHEGLVYLLFVLLIGLGIVGGWLGYRFVMPQTPGWATTGTLADYPPRAAPYEIKHHRIFFYLVNDGLIEGPTATGQVTISDAASESRAGIFLIRPITHYIQSCNVAWESNTQTFVSPCSGTYYSVYGDYILGPPPVRGLDRLPVRITDAGEIQVMSEAPIAGRTPEETAQLCARYSSGGRYIPPGQAVRYHAIYPDECDYRAVAYHLP